MEPCFPADSNSYCARMGHSGNGPVGVMARLATIPFLVVSCGISQNGLIGWSGSDDAGPRSLPPLPVDSGADAGRPDGPSASMGVGRDETSSPDAAAAPMVSGTAPADAASPAPDSATGRSDVTPPAPESAAPSAVNPEPGASPSSIRILRARKVKADRITAGVVFARKLDAKTGAVGALSDPLPETLLAESLGEGDVETDELTVDVLYADQIRADAVQIAKAHVTALKIKDTEEPPKE
jgi:hypothetical protein